MTNTKAEILALLKRNGGHSVGELATALGLAPITIRQHLTHLERDGLIVAERRPRNGGQPTAAYRLTAKAHAAAFPRRSDRLTELLIREVGFLDGSELAGRSEREKMSLVVQRLARRVADEYVPLVRNWSLEERVVFAAEVMHADGGFAEWEAQERGYEIRDYNCLFHRLLAGDGAKACEWHHTFLSSMLGTQVHVSPCPDGSEQCCRFVIESAVPATAGAGTG